MNGWQIGQLYMRSRRMIQYDRITELFVPPNDCSQDDVVAYAKLNIALAEVRQWLEVKRRNGRYAHGFLVELALNSLDRSFDIHGVYDEIGILEGTDSRVSLTKKPRKMRSPLHDLWHKHYFQASFIPRNLSDEAEKMSKDGRWESIFSAHYGKYLHEVIDQISHEIIDKAYECRARDHRITGEFIVYKRQTDGSNYYLTIGKHGEWDAIRVRVDTYEKFDGDK